MSQQSQYIKKCDFYQKFLIIDSYLDNPVNPDSIFSLLGWFQMEKDELIRIELFHTITILLYDLLKKSCNRFYD